VRPLTPGDVLLAIDLLVRLSTRSAQLRFFQPLQSIEAMTRQAARMVGGDPRLQTALAATIREGGEEQVVAVVELVQSPTDLMAAEFAIVVRDDYQREGLGRMLSHIAIELARVRGMRTLRASVLAENRAIMTVLRGLGLPITTQTSRGETTALLKLP
jgi:acetyltransferase